MTIDTIHWLVVAGIFWAVIFRARLMDDSTPLQLKAQYGVLLAGAALSLPIFIPDRAGIVVLGLSILLYLMLDARRWRHGVPR
jgi:hypothetical protein